MAKIDVKKITKELVEDFLTQLGLDADIEINVIDSGDAEFSYLQVDLSGDNLGEIIGYRGRMLESVQTILGLMISKELERGSVEEKYRVLIDVNQYQDQREKYLEGYAQRAAEEVRQSKQPMELSPMKPSERRIVHMVLRDQEGIITESKGEGDDRRVVILPK